MELQPEAVRQQLLCREEDPRSAKLMQVMDALNGQYGRNTLFLGSSGIQHRWSAKFERRTARYTTNWQELPTVS